MEGMKTPAVLRVQLQLPAIVVTPTLRSEMSSPNRSASAATKCHNRVLAVMAHVPRYSFRGTSRLAADTGVSKSTISHLVRGLNIPLYPTARQAVKSLELHLGRPLDLDEVISLDGVYPTASVCKLCGCSGCLPDSIYEADGSRKPAYDYVVPGHWTGDVDEFKLRQQPTEDPGTE